jgi:hypothetical protein
MADSNHQGMRAASFDSGGTLVGSDGAHLSDDSETIELALHLPDGRPWPLMLSSGIERFIGSYPRLPGFNARGACLTFRRL